MKFHRFIQLLGLLAILHPWHAYGQAAAVKIDPRDIKPGTVNEQEFGALDGITSNIQQQINSISTSGNASAWASYSAITNVIPSISNWYSLGSIALPWKALHLGTNGIYIGGEHVLWLSTATTSLVAQLPITTPQGVWYVTNPVAGQITSADTSTWIQTSSWVDTNSNALEQLLYVTPSVSLTGGGSYDYSNLQVNVDLSWTCNKTMVTRDLSAPVPVGDRPRGAGQNGSYTHAGANIAANTTYTITVNDGTTPAVSSTSLSFYSRRYWGLLATTNLPSAATITTWANELTSSKGVSSKSLSPANEYVTVAYYSALGACTTFSDGNFTYDVVNMGSVTITNAYGWVGTFSVYRWPNVQSRTLTFSLQ